MGSLGTRTQTSTRQPEDHEPGETRHGWQHEATSRVESVFRANLRLQLAEPEQALLRSQSEPLAGIVLSVAPSSTLTRIESHLFRVVLLRRLRLPLPLSVHQCRCGRSLDVFGHHRAACARAGVLGRRGFAVESAGARMCREAGGRVVFNAMLRDFDLGAPNPLDSRRVEILADGLPLFGGAQLAVDTTLVSALHCDGSAHSHAANVEGAALFAARRRKDRTYPELVNALRQSSPRCLGRRSGRPMVGGNSEVLEPPRQSEGQKRAAHLEEESGASVAPALGRSFGLRSRRKHSQPHCLICGSQVVWTGMSPPPMRW